METITEFVDSWGFCPHPEQLLETESHLCEECQEAPSQRSFSYEALSTLTHERQVAIFGFCSCEDNEGNENPYEDCQKGGEK
jgi:hypothetical protein